MKKLFNKGFTLIELLVVLGVIAILATAILAAINPIEQINKARDQKALSDAANILNALERYYAARERYPITNNAALQIAGATGKIFTAPYDSSTYSLGNINNSFLQELVDTGELKNTIQSSADFDSLSVQRAGGSENFYVCVEPQSKQQTAVAEEGCTNASGTSTEYKTAANCAVPGAERVCIPR